AGGPDGESPQPASTISIDARVTPANIRRALARRRNTEDVPRRPAGSGRPRGRSALGEALAPIDSRVAIERDGVIGWATTTSPAMAAARPSPHYADQAEARARRRPPGGSCGRSEVLETGYRRRIASAGPSRGGRPSSAGPWRRWMRGSPARYG